MQEREYHKKSSHIIKLVCSNKERKKIVDCIYITPQIAMPILIGRGR